MSCSNPRTNYSCGQCLFCRVVNHSNWLQRLQLEFGKRPNSVFLTWTYSDEFLPVFEVSKRAQLYKPDLVQELDRLRSALRPKKITIFAVGEYGGYLFGSSKAKRPIHPHYHVMIFCDQPFSQLDLLYMQRSFKFGHSHVLQTTKNLMSYITGYTLKKLTNDKSMNRIGFYNLRPEFIYSSRRPAIGDIVEQLEQIEEIQGLDIQSIRIDGEVKPLARYLRLKKRYQKDKVFLNLKNEGDYLIYETRRYFNSERRMDELRKKKEEEDVQLLSDPCNAKKTIYEIRSDLLKQKRKNFTARFKARRNDERDL
ncbi:MAG: replication initiator protein [Microviridae sp.]|nr:MAG: replication initiator protein [Microviridae sp.]